MISGITTALIALISGGVVPIVLAIMQQRSKKLDAEAEMKKLSTVPPVPYDQLSQRVAELEQAARETSARIALLEREQRVDRNFICDLVETMGENCIDLPKTQPLWLQNGGCS